ncbi:hypothetical protein VW35_00765 [Devosia soli]|uniref:Pectate lyase superfamily protein domain-containing protein n=1 Tax=Devosia soli TaxID=361041 RepID=A0A0F5LER0_9HYPH|nr:hypothetical protein [Devosia soli]KKB80775.1 hypothetical protein VW35_00765 [Devosia soli]
MTLTPAQVFRRYETDGVPDSGKHQVDKDEVIQLLSQLFGSAGGLADGLVDLNALSDSFVPVYLSTATVQAATIRAGTKVLRVAGYAVPGDGGSAQWKRVASAPTHGAGIRSIDRFLPNGSTDGSNGGWWDVDEAFPNELMFGGVASRTNAQQTAAIQAMLNYCGAKATKGYIAAGHLLTSGLVVPDFVTVEWAKRGYASNDRILDKVFNGDMIIMGDGAKLVSPALRGNSANWSGRGVVIDTGSDQVIDDPYMIDMASYCLEFPTGGKGIRFHMNGGLIQSASGYAVRMPATEATTTGYRHFTGVHTGGTPFIDLRNGDYTILDGCVFAGINFGNTTTGRTKITNCRNADPAGTLIFGIEHTFALNHCAAGLTLGAGAQYCKVIGNIVAGGLSPINNSGNATNQIV